MDIAQCYEVLGLDSNASLNEVTQAYRDLVKVWNPERFAHDPPLQEKAEKKLREIDTAFDAIMKACTQAEATADAEATIVEPSIDIDPTHEDSSSVKATPATPKQPFSLTLLVLCVILAALIVGGVLSPITVARVAYCVFEPSGLLLLGLTFWSFRTADKHRAKDNKPSAETAAGIGLVLLFLLVVYVWQNWQSLMSRSAMSPSYGSSNTYNAPIASGGLAAEDESRLKEIMQRVMTEENYLTPTIRAEFWQIVDRSGSGGEAEITTLRENMIFKTDVYNRHFFEDGLVSLRTRQPFKSEQRKQDEQRMISMGISSDAEIIRSDELMTRIANHEPQTAQGKTIVFNKVVIQKILDNLDSVKKRFDTLLTRP